MNDCTELQGKVVLVTVNEYVKVVVDQLNTDVISPCSHEEADTKVILKHCLHSLVAQDWPLGQWTLMLLCWRFHSIFS